MKTMKWRSFLCLAGICWAVLARSPVRAEEPVFLEEPSLKITLQSAERTPEGTRITLSCLNRTEEEEAVLFLVPKTDRVDTVFESGWPGEKIPLPPGRETGIGLTVLPAETETPGDDISMRISFHGQLSSEGHVFPGEEGKIIPADFGEGEEQQVRDEVQPDPDLPPDAVILRDRITAEEAEKLDYGLAWICLREEDRLLPFCRIPMRVEQTGEAEARYSGTAAVFAETPGQPLETEERLTEDGWRLETAGISMTGESVFYATMKLVLEQQGTGPVRITRQELFSSELGGSYDRIPLGLLDTAELMLRELEKTEAPVETVDTRSAFLPLKKPLTVRLLPAEKLGEIWVFCEYFFRDGTDTVHPPFPLPGTGNRP